MAGDWLAEELLEQAVELYEWRGAVGEFQWLDHGRLLAVGRYLLCWEAIGYWRAILGGGPRGYSLFLHEWAELQGYHALAADPFDYAQQVAHYRPLHALALLAEHRFLQTVASVMGYEFSLRELVVHNPHGDPSDEEWEGDWDVLTAHCGRKMNRADREFGVGRREAVRDFYRKLGFAEITHDA